MINSKFKKVITILILIVMLFPHGMCLAVTQAEAGAAIAQYAYNFCTTLGYNSPDNKTIYDHDSAQLIDRPYGYKLELHSGTAQHGQTGSSSFREKQYTDKYPMDCVGFVCSMIHQSLGIGDENFTYFISSGSGIDNCGYFEVVTGSPQPGDVYRSSGHVMIYLGEYGKEYTIAEAWGSEWQGAILTNSSTSGYTAYRIKAEKVSDLDPSELSIKPFVKGASGLGGVDQSKFYYNGIPDGKYSVTSVNILEWIIDALKNIFTFLINLITYIIRMVFVGWTFIIEELFTAIIKGLTGEDDILEPDATNYGESGNQFTDDNITIDKIIFDEVKVFNINFFKSETAEEATAEE